MPLHSNCRHVSDKCTHNDVRLQGSSHEQPVARRSTFAEGLYSGLVASPFAASHEQEQQAVASNRDAKLQLLVEAPAAVEDALASVLNHIDPEVQVDPMTCQLL